MNVIMIARGVRGALVLNVNGVLEKFENSSLRKLLRHFGFLFILHDRNYVMYILCIFNKGIRLIQIFFQRVILIYKKC